MGTERGHPLRVLVVEEHAAVRQALAAALATAAEIGEVRAAGNPERALALAAAWRPDVILLEVKRRDGRGLELCQALAALPGARVLVVTAWTDALEELATSQARVAGYVLKDTRPEELLQAILRASTAAPQH